MCSPATGARPVAGAPRRSRPRQGSWSRTSRPAGAARCPGREGRRRAGRPPRGPARAEQGVPARARFPAGRRPGRAHPTHGRGRAQVAGSPADRLPHGQRLARRRGRQGTGGQRVADLRRGPPRRRAGREGLGRRPADRGGGGRDARRRRRPRRRDPRLRARAPADAWASWWTTWCPAPRSTGSCRPGPRLTPLCARTSGSSGHPYVDVWQSVRPGRLGLQAWPVIPRGQSWKHGICAQLGWPHRLPDRHRPRVEADPRAPCAATPTSSRRCSASVEELIDFVTEPGA